MLPHSFNIPLVSRIRFDLCLLMFFFYLFLLGGCVDNGRSLNPLPSFVNPFFGFLLTLSLRRSFLRQWPVGPCAGRSLLCVLHSVPLTMTLEREERREVMPTSYPAPTRTLDQNRLHPPMK